ncbi:hypothetical protein JCM11491_005478 [Sporobolomyces phaffii]
MDPPSPSEDALELSLTLRVALARSSATLTLTDSALVIVEHDKDKRIAIPYLELVAVSYDAPHVTLSALVPASPSPSSSTTSKLYRLTGTPTVDGADPRKWCTLAERRAYPDAYPPREFHVVVNPIGGKGLAKRAWLESVQPVLDAAAGTGVRYTVSFTGPVGSATHAERIGRRHDPTRYCALIAVSGDGIVHELLNGLARHESGKGQKALRESPVVHVPCGSGNALATSVVGPDRVRDWKWCTLVALKGRPIAIDLCAVTQRHKPTAYSFLTQAFGLMADLDLGTEHLRFLGDFRFTLGYIQGAVARRAYPMKLTVLVENSSKLDIARRYNAALATTTTDRAGGGQDDDDDLMPPLEFGAPDDRLGDDVEREMREKRTVTHLPKDGELDGNGKWWTIDLMGGGPRPTPTPTPGERGDKKKQQKKMDKAKEKGAKGVFFLYGGKMPWISKDVMLFPPASPASGFVDLCLVAPMSPLEALTAMDHAETGALYHHPALLYVQTRAYRLSFPHADPDPDPDPDADSTAKKKKKKKKKKALGYVSIDGEKVDHADFNVEVLKGLARVMVLDGKLRGSKPIERV